MLTDFLLRVANPLYYVELQYTYTTYPCKVLLETPTQLVVISMYENKGYIVPHDAVRFIITREDALYAIEGFLQRRYLY
jgi:hypothetical protein